MPRALILLGLGLFAAGWIVPGHYVPWPAFQQQWAAGLGVALVGLGAAAKRPLLWQWPLSALVLLALALVPVAQRLAGQIRFLSDAVLPALFIGAFALSIAVGARLARAEPRWSEWFMTALLAAALASTGIALAQWLGVEAPLIASDVLARGARPYANLAQPNHLATLLALGLAATVHLFERHLLNAVTAAVTCAWLGFGLVMTQSRTGWLFVGALALWWLYGGRDLRLRAVGVAAICVAFVGAVLLWTSINQSLLLADPPSLGERTSPGLRVKLWQVMLEAIGRSPWLGWGWNQVSVGHLAVAYDHDAGQRVFENAHSIVLDLPLWMGVPLAALVLVLAVAWLVRKIRACSDGTQWSLLLAVAAIGLHALTEYPLDYAYFLLTLGLLIGTLEGLALASPAPSWPAISFVAPWALATAALVWVGVEYMRVEEAARQVRLLLAGVGIDKQSFVPPPETALLDAPREFHRFLITPAHDGMSDAELNWMRDVVSRHPSAFAMVRYAHALGVNGRNDDAARVLRALCNIQTPQRCQQARESWRAAQAEHPRLAVIPAP